MHLKSLTVKGFKSFASATTLRFEPGVTCVVGPNGSGKSNVVDAISWVLGEQGAKALRGGKMEDVIFAGTAGRAPLGRAEVTLTIDNSDNALPIDYTEVSVTRRMFRSGDSEYEINGDSCRLLDIQELLSDSGIGREMHVIVGQGQLDSVLSARPEDRRGFIEEAAGVLKHRKRKEKALRKLDAMQANLTRVTDLTAELRRQLKPLGRQAEVARRAATIQADLRDSRLRLLADDLTAMRSTLQREVADETAMRERRTAVEAELTERNGREVELEAALATDAPQLATAQDTFYRLSAIGERLRGLSQLATERLRHLSAPLDDPASDRDPDELERRADELAHELSDLRQSLESNQSGLAQATEQKQAREMELRQAEQELVAAVRAVADRREGLARLTGQVNALRTRSAAAADEIARLGTALNEARTRTAEAQHKFDQVQQSVGALDEGEHGLDERHEDAVLAHERVASEVRSLTEAMRDVGQEIASWTARKDALALGLTRKDGTGALLAAGDRLPGLLGSLAEMLHVESGFEAALSAALGALADAAVMAGPRDARAAIELLKSDDGGRAGIMIAGNSGPSDRSGWPQLPADARWAVEVITAPEAIRPALHRALDRVVVVADLDAGVAAVSADSTLRAVTRAGDVLGGEWAQGGSAKAPSTIEIQAAVDEAESKRSAAEARKISQRDRLEQLRAQEVRLAADVQTALRALHESDARMSAVAEELGDLGSAARNASSEADRLARAQVAAEAARDRDLEGLAELEERLQVAESTPVDLEPSSETRDRLSAEVTVLRQSEVELRLGVRTTEERTRALAGRVDSLRRSAASERDARARLARRRAARQRGADVAVDVQAAAMSVASRLETSLALAAQERDAIAQSRVEREGELRVVRSRVRELNADLDRLTDAVHRDEVARAEQKLRIEQVEQRAAEEYGVAPEALLAEYGPAVLVQPTQPEVELAEADGSSAPEPAVYDRAVQQKRAAKADRELTLLGKVNPLALEEFAALEERHQFLSDQLEDLKNTRRDLLTVVADVDERILEVFTAAYWDVAREFEIVFATLFPGGEGRLVLTDPDNMLTTGIEVEARPPGKKVKRLSLLSGGERSLTAVAILVAIFRARPSPFYVMDEVEAALDDINLGRLIGLFEQLRNSSQLIIITHQKRTMEIADALYGVTMRGDGITQVISQRMRQSQPA